MKKNKKHMILAFALVLIVGLAVGGTVAYVAAHSETFTNVFKPVPLDGEIEEEVEDAQKTSVKVKNTGESTAYVRLAIVSNKLDADDSIVGAASPTITPTEEYWFKASDGYYYCRKPVEPNESTDEFLSARIDLTGIQVTVMAELIQAEPTTAVTEAWSAVKVDNASGNLAENG